MGNWNKDEEIPCKKHRGSKAFVTLVLPLIMPTGKRVSSLVLPETEANFPYPEVALSLSLLRGRQNIHWLASPRYGTLLLMGDRQVLITSPTGEV